MEKRKLAGFFGLSLLLMLNSCQSKADTVGKNNEWKPHVEAINGDEMAFVPPGCFMMGSDGHRKNEQPAHEVCFDEPFWIDIYEVTNRQHGSTGCEVSSSRPNQPRNCISWFEAITHCKNRGTRLPSETEWEYAARGPDGLIYSWGNSWEPNKVVNGASSSGETEDAGSMPGGVSWVGAYNLGGNVREWVNDWYDEEYYANSPRNNPQGPGIGEYRVVRTNSFNSHYRGFSEGSYRTKGYPALGNSNRCFRCAADFSG